MMRISTDIAKAVALLEKEELVAIPTETVYGLAGNIYSEQAVKKIFAMKQRPFFNPLIVHIGSLAQLSQIVHEFPENAAKLADAFWPGPLTMVLTKKTQVPDLVTGGKTTVAVRMPDHPTALALLQKLSFPLAAPSANPFGSISPTRPAHVDRYFGQQLAMILDGGACSSGIESTIVGFEGNQPVIYRLGAISIEDIKAIIGDVAIKNKNNASPEAPGMLEKHYAPQTKTYLVDQVLPFVGKYPTLRIGVITFSTLLKAATIKHCQVLSTQGDCKEAAANLYEALHTLDHMQLDMIVVERMPNKGVCAAINDRLERAAK